MKVFCSHCKNEVEPTVETGYESGPFPTAYEDYYTCPLCGMDIEVDDQQFYLDGDLSDQVYSEDMPF